MPTTEHIHLPLYTDEETPDLSTTGHYNQAMEIIDDNADKLEKEDAELAKDIADERDARVAGDAALDGKVSAETAAREAADNAINATLATKADQSALNKEVADRKAADTALGSRIDNAETEISANSADLTGIKGLTYGTGKQVFLEESNGEYSSPALVEIQHEISDLQAQGGGTEVNSIAPLVVDTAPTANDISSLAIGYGARAWSSGIALGNRAFASATGTIAIGSGDSNNYATADHTNSVAIGNHSLANTVNSVAIGANSRTDEDAVVSVGNPVMHYTRRVTNVANPTNAQDAATKNYVDTAIAGASSGLTVISVAEGNEAADVYAKVQADWPNCVLRGANYMYPVQKTPDGTYLFSTIGLGTMYVCMVTSTNIQTADTPIVLPDTTFGDLTAGVHS